MQIWSFTLILKGSLGEMVTLCNGCNVYETWAARTVGAEINIVWKNFDLRGLILNI